MKTIRKTFQGVMPENKILNSESNSQTDTYSCDYINNMKVDAENIDELPVGTRVEYNGTEVPEGWEEVDVPEVKPIWEKLYGEINTQGVFTLANNVYSYDLIMIITSRNDYDHYQYNNFYMPQYNGLVGKQQKLNYVDITSNTLKSDGYFNMTEYTINTEGLTNIATARILGIYGIKFRG